MMPKMTIEVQLASVVTSFKTKDSFIAQKKETPWFYKASDESFCGTNEPGYTVTSRVQAQQDVPRGSTSILDPKAEEARQQDGLSQSFVLEDLGPKVLQALQMDAEVLVPHMNHPQLPQEGEIHLEQL